MNVIIVSGPEATGKTAIGKAIAKSLGYQYSSKDMIKEALFDSESHSTWDYGWYESRAKAKFFDSIKDIISQNRPAVIESNFIGSDKQKLAKLLNDETLITEIFCTARGLTSLKRFVSRNESGARHKGHHDRRWYVKVALQDFLRYANVKWPYRPTGLSGRLLIVDSTNFSQVNYDEIIAFIRQTTSVDKASSADSGSKRGQPIY